MYLSNSDTVSMSVPRTIVMGSILFKGLNIKYIFIFLVSCCLISRYTPLLNTYGRRNREFGWCVPTPEYSCAYNGNYTKKIP